MATVTELVTEFKFSGSTAPLGKYNDGLGKAVGMLAGMVTAAAAAGAAIAKWTTSTLKGEQALINLSAETGIAVERIQELQYIAEVSNSSTEALSSSLSGLATKLGEAAQNGSDDFSRLGISVRDAAGNVKGADRVLSEIGMRFRQMGLSRAEQQSFAEKFGIDKSLITMLGRTSGEMAGLSKRARELGILTEEQTMFAMDYNDAMTTSRFAIDGVRRLLAVGLGPELKKMTESFTDLLAKNRDWIINGIKAAVEILHDFLKMIKRIWPFLVGLAGAFVVLKIATLGLSGALGVLLSPAIVITAAILALILIVEDLVVAFSGGKSVIRDFFLEFFGIDITPVLHAIVDGFLEMVDTVMSIVKGFMKSIGSLFSGIGKILKGDFVGGLEDLKNAFSIWIDTIKNMFLGMFGGVFDWAKDAILGLVPDWVLDLLDIDTGTSQKTTADPDTGTSRKATAPDWVLDLPDIYTGTSQKTTADPGTDKSFHPGGTTTGDSYNTTRSTVSQDVKIDVHTSDPVRAGEVTADRLQNQMRDAQTQADRGGM